MTRAISRRLTSGDRIAFAGAAAVIVPLLILAAVAYALFSGPVRDTLSQASVQLATDVAQTVGGTIERAVEVGIPLDQLYGVDGFLAQVVNGNAEIAAIAIRDSNDVLLYSHGNAPPRAPSGPARFSLTDANGPFGSVVVYPVFATFAETSRSGFAFVAGLVLTLGLVIGIYIRLILFETVGAPSLRLKSNALSVAGGRLSLPSLNPPGDPLAVVARDLSAPVRDMIRRLHDAELMVEEIRTIDFKGELASRLEPVVERLSHYRMSRRQALLRGTGWFGWWAIPLLIVATAGDGLATGFAADRVGPHALAFLAIGGGLAAEAMGALLALAILVFAMPRPRYVVVIAGTLAVALASVAIFETHALWDFLVARAATGFALILAVFALLTRPGGFVRRPIRAFVFILAMVAIGPAVGGLFAELGGRRLTFLAMAIVLALLTLRYVLRISLRTRRMRVETVRPTLPVALAIVGAVVGPLALIEVNAGGAWMIDRHSQLGCLFAMFGVGISAAFAAGYRIPLPLCLLLMAAALAGAAVTNGHSLGLFTLAPVVGFLTGALYLRAGGVAFTPGGLAVAAVATLAVAGVAGLAALGSGSHLFLLLTAALLIALAFASLATGDKVRLALRPRTGRMAEAG